jgi:hypothetical protein
MATPGIPENVLGYECRHVTFCPPPEGDNIDLHVIKTIVHKKDGTTYPEIKLVKNFQRPYWITENGYRNHNDKKEWEDVTKLKKYTCTQTDLARAISKNLGIFGSNGDTRRLFRSPYIYGADILSTAVINERYKSKFPDLITPASAAMFDVETDVLHGTDEIIMATLSFKSKVVTVIKKSFLKGYSDQLNRLQATLDKYLGDIVKQRGIEWEVLFVDNEYEVVTECYKRAHKWMPDFVAIWNINFDMPKMLLALKKACIDPAEVFSDPAVPARYRHFTYKVGPKQKMTASGQVNPIKPAAQWHTVFCPSSFYFIDAMCAYKQIRTGKAEEPSYSLDNILDKHLGIRKLKFTEADGMTRIDWHQFMQEKYPFEYVIYNVFDCISMELLDESTNDLSLSLPMFSGYSDMQNFKSQPRRLADKLHYYALENGKVIGTTSDQMKSPLDDKVIGLEGWIVTLPAHLVMENGLKIISENKTLSTNIRAHVGDLDVSASYPNGGASLNISKETTHKELVAIEGVTEAVQRAQGINLSGGHTNAVEFCNNIYKLPRFSELLAEFESELAPA